MQQRCNKWIKERKKRMKRWWMSTRSWRRTWRWKKLLKNIFEEEKEFWYNDVWDRRYKEFKCTNIVNSKNEISSTMSQRRSELFRNYFRAISRVNRLSNFNDRAENFKVIKFLIQFGSNIHNRTQSFITMINLNDTDRYFAYLIQIMLIICWLNRMYSMSDTMIVIFEVLSKKFIWHFFYVCELLFKISFNFL